MRGELEKTFERYLQASSAKREEARAAYLTKLRDFTTRVLGRPSKLVTPSLIRYQSG